jgi:hypothetical protein
MPKPRLIAVMAVMLEEMRLTPCERARGRVKRRGKGRHLEESLERSELRCDHRLSPVSDSGEKEGEGGERSRTGTHLTNSM